MDRQEKLELQQLINSGSCRIKYLNLDTNTDWKRRFQIIICDGHQVDGYLACKDCNVLIAHLNSRKDWCNSHRHFMRCKERKPDKNDSFQQPSLPTKKQCDGDNWSVLNLPDGKMKIKRNKPSKQNDESSEGSIGEADSANSNDGEEPSPPAANKVTMKSEKNVVNGSNAMKMNGCMNRKRNRCPGLYSDLEDESDNDDWFINIT